MLFEFSYNSGIFVLSGADECREVALISSWFYTSNETRLEHVTSISVIAKVCSHSRCPQN